MFTISTAEVRRLTVAPYDAMGRAGILTPDDRVELLEGLLVEKTTKNPAHRIATKRTRAGPRSRRRRRRRSASGSADIRYIRHIVMATTVHIPKALLAAADRRARVLKISRNRLIIRALEQELTGNGADWSPGFFEDLADVSDADARAFATSMRAVRTRRTSKKPPRL